MIVKRVIVNRSRLSVAGLTTGCQANGPARSKQQTRRSSVARRGASRRSGLTLFEVLLALVIFVAALSAIGQLISSGVRGALQSRFQLQAAQLCQAKMGEVVCGAQPLTPTQAVYPEDKAWIWSLQVMPSPVQGLMKVQVTVERLSQNKQIEIKFAITRYVRDPAVYIAAEEEAARNAEQLESESQ
jgi:general secretion pathway protein I